MRYLQRQRGRAGGAHPSSGAVLRWFEEPVRQMRGARLAIDIILLVL